jgi:hypothetical protein
MRKVAPATWPFPRSHPRDNRRAGSDEQYDLWMGDEAWELDYYLHENPEQK